MVFWIQTLEFPMIIFVPQWSDSVLCHSVLCDRHMSFEKVLFFTFIQVIRLFSNKNMKKCMCFKYLLSIVNKIYSFNIDFCKQLTTIIFHCVVCRIPIYQDYVIIIKCLKKLNPDYLRSRKAPTVSLNHILPTKSNY